MNNIFLIERPGKYTMFFLLKREKNINMEEFMKTHNISVDQINEHTDQIMDFYNDLIKFQNDKNAYINHITIFTYDENEIEKYVENIEKDRKFLKWITTQDNEWLQKIEKYFLNDNWFDTTDSQYVKKTKNQK